MPTKIVSFIAVVSIVAAISCFPGLLIAGEISMVPKVKIAGLYDDNVFFSNTDPVDDYTSIISPGLTFDYDSEISNLGADFRVDIYNYLNESEDLNTVDQYYQIDGKTKFTERLDLFADAAIAKDTTLDSELTESGTVGIRQDRDRYDLHGGVFFNFTELTQLGFDYRYRQTDYESESSEDNNEDVFSFQFNKRLKNELDMFSLVPSYAYKQSKINEVNTYRVSLGWTRFFSESFQIHVFLGVRQTEQYDRFRNKKETQGAIADLRFSKTTELTSTTIGYRRDQLLTAEGGVREVDRLYAELGHHFTERTAAGIDGNFYLARDVNESVNKDSQYFELKPWVQYNLTEEHLLRLEYSYQHDYDDAFENNKESSRNRVWLSVIFQFPSKW